MTKEQIDSIFTMMELDQCKCIKIDSNIFLYNIGNIKEILSTDMDFKDIINNTVYDIDGNTFEIIKITAIFKHIGKGGLEILFKVLSEPNFKLNIVTILPGGITTIRNNC